LPGGHRKNLHDERWRTTDVLLCHQRRLFVQHQQEIRFDDVEP
jgi:hypothetical protein